MTRKTHLFQQHVDLGAKMVPFAGYDMPLSYQPISQEHTKVREDCGIFDVSHMGQFIIKGKEALQLVLTISSNDAESLESGHAQYSCLMNKEGTIVDDMIVYRLFQDQCSEGEMAFMLVVNASNIEKDLAHIVAHNSFDTKVINISDHTSLLAIQGPSATKLLGSLCDVDLTAIPFYHFVKSTFGGFENVLISNTGYTGAGGLELYLRNVDVVPLWKKLVEDLHITPIGLGARDTLRLEKGYCLYGNELSEKISPAEAGLNWVCKPNREIPFLGFQQYLEAKANKQRKYLVGLKLEGRRIPRHGYEVFSEEERLIGHITSGAMSPSLQQPIGMAYVEKSHRKLGSNLKIQMGSKRLPAKVCKTPFV